VVDLGPEFTALEAVSIDNAIMEKTDRGFVLPIDVGWDDVGSYRSLLDASELDPNGNHVSGDVTLSDVARSFVKSTSRRVVVSGVADVVVVETPEAVLVVPLDRAQEVRELQRRPDQS
jgi:mannose-1-phosphate guanylyltransferase